MPNSSSNLLLLLVPALVLAFALLARTRAPAWTEGPTRWLGHRHAPLAAALLTALVLAWTWGGLDPIGWVHDEVAYLLQARIYASGRWTAPGRPLPEFFEQFHVFVTPRLAPKYPPGHAIALVPGVWLGMPALMPLLFSAVAGGLLFALARRLANGWVALMAWVLWLFCWGSLYFRTTYLSETTSGALWMAGWWALLEWKEKGGRRWLLALAACVAWMALTRPATAVAYAIPVAVVVLRETVRRRAWRDFALATVVGCVIMSIWPLWIWRTTGDLRVNPYAHYSEVYFPFDAPGFGLDTTPPRRELPADMRKFAEQYAPTHALYTPERLPANFLARWKAIYRATWSGWRMGAAAFALVGLLVLPAAGWFAVATCVLLTLVYLSFGHPAGWMVYYLEAQTVLAFLTALGVWAVLAAVARGTRALRRIPLAETPRGPAMAAALLVAVALVPSLRDVARSRGIVVHARLYHRLVAETLAELPEEKAIVFVRYAPWHNLHTSLIANEPDLEKARLWVVYDRGPENARLMALAPERAAYLLDEDRGTVERLPRPGAAPAAPGAR